MKHTKAAGGGNESLHCLPATIKKREREREKEGDHRSIARPEKILATCDQVSVSRISLGLTTG